MYACKRLRVYSFIVAACSGCVMYALFEIIVGQEFQCLVTGLTVKILVD